MLLLLHHASSNLFFFWHDKTLQSVAEVKTCQHCLSQCWYVFVLTSLHPLPSPALPCPSEAYQYYDNDDFILWQDKLQHAV
jgi:hypothetical protein